MKKVIIITVASAALLFAQNIIVFNNTTCKPDSPAPTQPVTGP